MMPIYGATLAVLRDVLQQRGQDGEDQADADGIERDGGKDDRQRCHGNGRFHILNLNMYSVHK